MEKNRRSSTVYNFIDKHIREIKWISYGVGGVALIIIFRSVRMTQKFTHVNQIPDRFIQSESTLQGIVKHVSDEGLLHIEHIPIMEFKVLSKIRQTFQTNESDHCKSLSIKPAGIVMTDDGIKWLQTNTIGKHAWFQLFLRDPDALHCDVRLKMGRFLRSSICSELIKQGLCKIEHFDQPPSGDAFNQYLRELIAKEQKASLKDKGLWKEEKQRHYIWDGIAKKSSSTWSKIKEIIRSRYGRKER